MPDTPPMPPGIKARPPVTGASHATAHPATRPLGLRERHKIDKRERISAAALMLFAREGYDGTTLRDIASEADVALGTLSLYARDKRELVIMIFNRIIPPLLDSGREKIRPSQPLADNILAFFEPCYEAYASGTTLYRTVLGQIYNGPASVIAEENDAIRIRLMRDIAWIIGSAVDSGECRPGLDIAIQSRVIFYIYFTAVRVWLFGDDPQPRQGLADLHTLLQHHIDGMVAARATP